MTIEIEMIVLTETVAQRRAQKARAGDDSDQRERLDRELHAAGSWPFSNHDVQLEILHRGIEDFLDHPCQAVNLIDKPHIVLAEITDDRRQHRRRVRWPVPPRHADSPRALAP